LKAIIAVALLAAAAAGAIEVVYVKSFSNYSDYGLAVSSAGYIFNPGWAYTYVYTPNGSLVRTWPNQEIAYDCDVDNHGYVYQCEAEGAQQWWPRRIYKYTEAGSFVASFGFGWSLDARGIASDDGGYLYTCSYYAQTISKITTAGSLVATWPYNHWKLTVGPEGYIYTTGGTPPISAYTPEGSVVRRWGQYGQGPGLFETARDITFDRFGYAHIGDEDGVEVFTSTGSFVTHYGEQETGRAVLLDASPSGYIYVVDWGEIDVYYVSGDAVAPASLGRIKALFR